ncbi:MAG TPA: FimV/HubP family polar landmark protein [Noviherbaspirillum sp.]|nr:FimV/HubP family polar landmark protein [Noviherbaspirillum sp.]
MHSNKRPTFGSFNLKTLSAAVASALLFSNAYAAGLGKLTVLSSLGQPLRAEIELTSVSKDEAGALAAKLASVEAFQQANIDFNAALSSLRFSIEQRGQRQYIRVTSAQPLNEPFVDMLMELSSPNGRLIREYTFLLDPAELNKAQPAQSASIAPSPASVARTPQQSAPVPAPAPQVQQPVQTQQSSQQSHGNPSAPQLQQSKEAGAADDYRVRSGDTLGKIAGQIKPNGISLDQMLVALYQANPEAFIGQNMNRLKAGQILAVPSAETARSISRSEARGIIVAQAADFNNYRSKLAGQVAGAEAQKSAETKQSAGGKISAKVEEQPTPASEAKDKLKLSNTMSAPAANADKAGTGAATTEDKIAKDKAVAEANARVKELEKNVSDLQKLAEIKNKALAEQQKQADAAKPEAKPETPAGSPVAGSSAAVADAAAEVKPATSPEASPEDKAPAVPPVAATPPVAKPKPVVAPSPPPEPSFIDDLMENPMALPGIGALLVALGALGVYRARRQKQDKQFADSIITDSSLKANSLFGSTGGQSVDTNNSVFNSSFAPSASQLDTNEVDPVAEADVYIAYGRDAQAEEILKEALRTQPERQAVRLKLLEIYSNRKDLRAFEVLATELYGLTKGEGDDWAQAAAMGIAMDPNNPLYAGGKVDKADASGNLIAPTIPLEEQGLATLLSSTQPDASPLESNSALDADTAYFGNTNIAAEKPLEPQQQAEVEEEVEKPASNEMDFNLESMDMQDMAVPNTIPRPMPAEPPADLASIDFNFLDEPSVATPAPQAEPTAEIAPKAAAAPEPIQDLEFSLDNELPQEQPLVADIPLNVDTPVADIPPLSIDIPGLEELPSSAEVKADASSDSMDFDLSGINLDLPPVSGGANLGAASQEAFAAADDVSSSSTEMATKLDLAIAYQEIGDKEGARELLDEVLKGGTPEQSEKAKSLLLELA